MESEKHSTLVYNALLSILENSVDMMFVKNKDLVYVCASRSFAHMVGLSKKEDLIGKTDFDIFDHDLATKYTNDDRYVFEHEATIENYIEPLPDQGGEKSYSSTSKYLIRDEQGNLIGLYGIARDVSAQVQLEKEKEQSKLSRELFDHVVEADLTSNLVLGIEGEGWLQDLGQLDEYPYTEFIKELGEYFIHPEYQTEFLSYYDMDNMEKGFQKGIQEFTHITPVQVGEQRYRWIEFRSRMYHSRISNTLRITMFMKDKDSEVRHRQILQKKAVTDALTGLANRESILLGIERILSETSEEAKHALLFIDLDRFKMVNDHWGHQFGDQVLQESANRLQTMFTNGELLGRIGGDEFIVFLKEVNSQEDVYDAACQLVQALSSCIQKDGLTIKVTASIGIAMCEHKSTTMEQLYERADKAMYRAKEQQGDQVCFYEEGIA